MTKNDESMGTAASLAQLAKDLSDIAHSPQVGKLFRDLAAFIATMDLGDGIKDRLTKRLEALSNVSETTEDTTAAKTEEPDHAKAKHETRGHHGKHGKTSPKMN